jgi:hypothetical protein
MRTMTGFRKGESINNTANGSQTENSQKGLSQTVLSEKQEQLLSRFHDGQCSCLSAFLARRLISRSACARDFLSDLGTIKDRCADLARSDCAQPVDLWARINARIDQEQRAALYLGARRLETTSEHRYESLWKRVSPRHAMLGGLSGAAVAATLLVVMSRPTPITSFSAPMAGPVANNQFIQPVAIGNSTASGPRYAVAPVNHHHSMEVDWMRANGSLKLIPDPTGSSAIIWIRRRAVPLHKSRLPDNNSLRRDSLGIGSSAARLEATPLGMALDSPGDPLPSRPFPRQQLDEHRQSGEK